MGLALYLSLLVKFVIFCTLFDGHLALCEEDDPKRKVQIDTDKVSISCFYFLIKMSRMSPIPFLTALQLAVGNFPKPQSHLG